MLSDNDIVQSRHDAPPPVVSVSREQAVNIIHHHFTEHRNSDVQIALVPGIYHRHAKLTVYLIDILPANVDTTEHVFKCFLTLSTPDDDTEDKADDHLYRSNSLSTVLALSKLIQERTDAPLPEHTLDTSLSIVPYHYLLSPLLSVPKHSVLISLSEARKEGLLSPVEDARMDMRVGQYLGQMHSNIQNDWFGVPQPEGGKKVTNAANGSALFSFIGASAPPGGDAAYSWQETFVTLFEIVLARVEEDIGKRSKQKDQVHQTNGQANGVANGNGIANVKPKYILPSQDIHRSLSRAISFFLFDDVQVPSLVSHTTSADDIFVTLPVPSSGNLEGLPLITLPVPDPEIAYILPTLTNALWGDPLIETMFTPPGPSPGVKEGYVGAGGGPLIIFPRQKTKRLWYTLFSALLVLAEVGVVLSGGNEKQEGDKGEEARREADFAWKTVEECVEALKDAPCY
ncbi:hypothetical protein AX15_005258 [Amanita polypyramis BW_CC]|nr:hypothetical protein AX15_005258 [Amanita polypyramis BW_CC]